MDVLSVPFVKVLVSRNVVEVYRYERMPLSTERGTPEARPPSEADSLWYRKVNQRRSKWAFMRMVNSTFSSGSRFITFTFRDGVLADVTDVREANVYWNKFVKRMRRKFGDFEWSVVVEFQDKNGRGAVHYHMIANLPFVPIAELESVWGAGHVWIEKIDHVDNVGAYVVKYMAADMDDVRLCGLKAWRSSRNVKKPLELRGDDARDFLEGYAVQDRPVRMSKAYESEYNGLITYEQYNLG